MSTILIEKPGMLTTVQDLGREGFGPMGVSPSGAADAMALRIGNALVGNDTSAAALEMTLMGGTFVFPEGAVIALTGSDFGAMLGGTPIAMWTAQALPSGAKLSIGATKSGARVYLCVAGGILVPRWLGSASTHLLSALGGLEGRALRKGDVLRIGAAGAGGSRHVLAPHVLNALEPRKVLRVTDGPQADWFAAETRRSFLAASYAVTEESNRMGLRLAGPPLPLPAPREMISEGVSLGAVQVTPSGQPIILFVEQQTTGGYPKIANVIGADMHSVGQLRPRDEVRFERVSLEAARELWIEQQVLLASPERLFA